MIAITCMFCFFLRSPLVAPPRIALYLHLFSHRVIFIYHQTRRNRLLFYFLQRQIIKLTQQKKKYIQKAEEKTF